MDYELMVVLKPLLPEDIKSNLIKAVENLVKQSEGEIKSTDVWGKKHLSYPIGKQTEGYYIIYRVKLNPKMASEFDNKLKLTNGVLRFLRIKESEL